MKQVNELAEMIADVLALPQINEKTKERLPNSILSGRRKKLKFYTVCKRYLESNPSEDFCKREIARLCQRILLINNSYPAEKKFATIDEEKNFKKEFDKLWGTPKLKEQARVLKFLLK